MRTLALLLLSMLSHMYEDDHANFTCWSSRASSSLAAELKACSPLPIIPLERACPYSKAQPAGFRATPQLRCLALSRTSIRRKCHESVMSLVMGSDLKL